MAKSSKSAVKVRSAAAKSVTIHDQKLGRGEGGELHQIAIGKEPVLTTAQYRYLQKPGSPKTTLTKASFRWHRQRISQALSASSASCGCGAGKPASR